MNQTPARILVLLSGSGRTLLNIADAIDQGRLNARVVGVIASTECLGAQRARDRGFNLSVVPGVIPAAHLERRARSAHADWLVLAGYLKLLDIPPSLRGRVVNIHPALLPSFGGPGMFGRRVHQAVLDSGMTESGCTVHLCDENYDTGPIILQRRCPVLPDDNAETLAARVFEQECLAYPEALQLLIEGRAPATPTT